MSVWWHHSAGSKLVCAHSVCAGSSGGFCPWGILLCPQVSCCCGWKTDISFTGWQLMGILSWYLPHNPYPRPLAIAPTGGLLSPPLPTTVASVGAPGRTCWCSVPTEPSWGMASWEPEARKVWSGEQPKPHSTVKHHICGDIVGYFLGWGSHHLLQATCLLWGNLGEKPVPSSGSKDPWFYGGARH